MKEIPDIAPQNLDEWNYLVNATYENGLETYKNKVAEAKEQVLAQWNKVVKTKKAELLDQAKTNINSQTNDNGNPLSDKEKQDLIAKATTEIDNHLEKEKNQQLEQAASMVEQPESLDQIKTTYMCYYPHEEMM